MKLKVVVLGAGFGGLELTTILSEAFSERLELTLIDKNDSFVFGFSKLDVMFGRTTATAAHNPYSGFDKPGVRFVQTTIRSIDPAAKQVETDAGTFDGDVLVVALGAGGHLYGVDVTPTMTRPPPKLASTSAVANAPASV